MRYKTLGRTGLKVGEIGVGGVAAAGKYGPVLNEGADVGPAEPRAYKNAKFYPVAREAYARIMSRASELGMNFVDTAPSYGDSEEVLGFYLKENRKKWLVCTKIGTCGSWGTGELMTQEQIFEQVSGSMKRLQVDQLDLILIHSLDQYGKGEEAVERVLAPGGMVDAMRELKKSGRVRFIGTSGQLGELVPAVKSGAFDVILTYNTFNLLIQDAQEELFPLARKMNVGVILGGALYQGLLTGNPEMVLKNKGEFYEKNDPAYFRTEELVRKVGKLMDIVGNDARELRQLAMRFALSDPAVSVVVSGVRAPAEAEENAAVSELGPLSDAEMQKIMSGTMQGDLNI